MSIEDLKEFGKAVAENQEYREKCMEIGIDDFDGLMAYGKELGYEFSPDDALALSEEAGMASEELSEDDLEKIAGGGVTSTAAVVAVAGAVVGLVAGAAAGGVSLAVTSAVGKW